jgi:streptogramin lyase
VSKRSVLASGVAVLLTLVSTSVGQAQPGFVTSWNSIGIPTGLLADGLGHVFSTCESGSGAALRKFDLNGNLLAVFGASDPYEGYGVARLSDGSIAAVDYYGRRLQRFDENGLLLSTWSFGGSRAAYLAVDELDNCYITDDTGDRVRKFTSQGVSLADWASPNPTGIAYAGGIVYVAAREAGLLSKYAPDGTTLGSFPTGLTDAEQLSIDGLGNLFVADWGAYQLRKFAPNGTVTWTLSSSVPGYSFGPVRYHGVTVASDGTIYVGDYDHRRILVFKEGLTPTASMSWGQLKARFRPEAPLALRSK